METLTDSNSEAKAGKKFRLTVKSAEEAVRVIRDKLGENARVLSVRQVGGEGLKKFISSPKLEVIAEVPSINDSTEAISLENETGSTNPQVHGSANIEVPKTPLENSENLISSPSETFPVKPDEDESDSFKILAKTGFDQQLLNDIKSWPNWSEINNLPLAETLKEITIGLSDRFKSLNVSSVENRIALIGAPGVGKTTTLCKFLAHDVFMNKKSPNVLKVENGIPNPDDALRIFCEVVGVTLYRESSMTPASSLDSPLYLDFPGLSLAHMDDWTKAKQDLDDLKVETRVLVLNSAYDKQVLSKSINFGNNIGVTHIAFTHFDELSNSTKLWPLLLRNNLTPLCVCNGQNVTGDFSTSVLNQMIAKTFPEELYARGFSSYRKI